jgi:hypothetical protein
MRLRPRLGTALASSSLEGSFLPTVRKEREMRKSHLGIQATLAALVLSLLACSTTTFDSTWRAPDARPVVLTGKKVVGLFMSKNPATRRSAEDAMAREISARGAQGVPAYSILSDAEVKDQEAVRAKLESMGFSGVVVMRVVGRETQVNYQPSTWAGPPYRSFYGGYYRWGWGSVYDPGYLTVDQVVKVETLVYSLEQDKLIWAGISRTVDPTKVDSFVTELAKAVADSMRKDGLLLAT